MITVSDLQLSSELTEDYAKIIKSRNVLKQVIKELDLDLDYRGLSKLVSVTIRTIPILLPSQLPAVTWNCAEILQTV